MFFVPLYALYTGDQREIPARKLALAAMLPASLQLRAHERSTGPNVLPAALQKGVRALLDSCLLPNAIPS